MNFPHTLYELYCGNFSVRDNWDGRYGVAGVVHDDDDAMAVVVYDVVVLVV